MNFVFVEPETPTRSGAAIADGNQTQLPVLVAEAKRHPQQKAPAAEPGDKRRARRKPVGLRGDIADAQQSFRCTVVDMSATGARLELFPREGRRHGSEPDLPQRFFLVMETLLERSVVECIVMWHRGSRAGVQFVGPIDSTTKRLPQRRPGSAKPAGKAERSSLRRR